MRMCVVTLVIKPPDMSAYKGVKLVNIAESYNVIQTGWIVVAFGEGCWGAPLLFPPPPYP